MIKIAVVSGTPRPENQSETYKVIKEFESYVSTITAVETDIISLRDYDLTVCMGCVACQKSGECIVKDRMHEIDKKLMEADVIVFASPVHFNHVSSIFHNFIERSLVPLHTFRYLGKPFINIVTTNGSGEEDADKYLTKIGRLFGCVKIGSIYKVGNEPVKEKQFKKIAAEIKKYQEMRLNPALINSLYFSFMKKMIKDNQGNFEGEHKIWSEKGWFDKSYGEIYKEYNKRGD